MNERQKVEIEITVQLINSPCYTLAQILKTISLPLSLTHCHLATRYRFDELGVELFSDSDRLSYTSLSRSSSLIQFESLERQLQQSDSQISGSSPSIYSYEGASGNSTSGNTNQEINTSEKLSAPIAINLPTIKVITSNPPLPVVVASNVVQFTNSDSEPFSSGGSSTSGSFSSDDSELHVIADSKQQIVNDSSLSSTSSEDGKVSNSAVVVVGMIKANENRRKHSSSSFRAKNSVDSLSEDSGQLFDIFFFNVLKLFTLIFQTHCRLLRSRYSPRRNALVRLIASHWQ